MATYKNLYWTRIISISHFDEEADKKCPIGPDIVHEMDELAEIQEADLAEWSALWDPLAFHLSHPQPKITDHEYSEATLKALAVKAVDIRQSIKKKAVLYQQDDEIPLATSQPAAGRQGLKHSTRASNPEGLLEKEIRARQLRDEPAGCRYKKRKRKELSFLEMQEIVHCYLHRHHTQSDIARLYRISHTLVSRLVIESKRWPGKLRERKLAEKRMFTAGVAVVDGVEELQAYYKPITSANLVQSKVLDMSKLKVSRPKIRAIMRRECGLKYRLNKRNPTQINSERCLVLRQ